MDESRGLEKAVEDFSNRMFKKCFWSGVKLSLIAGGLFYLTSKEGCENYNLKTKNVKIDYSSNSENC